MKIKKTSGLQAPARLFYIRF